MLKHVPDAREDLLETLRLASVCAILAKPSAIRERALANLHQDEQSRMLPTWSQLDKVQRKLLLRGLLMSKNISAIFRLTLICSR